VGSVTHRKSFVPISVTMTLPEYKAMNSYKQLTNKNKRTNVKYNISHGSIASTWHVNNSAIYSY
jgi:hypothetical protein